MQPGTQPPPRHQPYRWQPFHCVKTGRLVTGSLARSHRASAHPTSPSPARAANADLPLSALQARTRRSRRWSPHLPEAGAGSFGGRVACPHPVRAPPEWAPLSRRGWPPPPERVTTHPPVGAHAPLANDARPFPAQAQIQDGFDWPAPVHPARAQKMPRASLAIGWASAPAPPARNGGTSPDREIGPIHSGSARRASVRCTGPGSSAPVR